MLNLHDKKTNIWLLQLHGFCIGTMLSQTARTIVISQYCVTQGQIQDFP